MDVEYGQYSVILLVEGFPPSHAGTITVYEDSQPGTLNDFLGAMTEDDARPEALRRFELMVEEVARNASAVAQDTAAAKKSASDAGTHQPVRRQPMRLMLQAQHVQPAHQPGRPRRRLSQRLPAQERHQQRLLKHQKVLPLQSPQKARQPPVPVRRKRQKRMPQHHNNQQPLLHPPRPRKRQKLPPQPGMRRPQKRQRNHQKRTHHQVPVVQLPRQRRQEIPAKAAKTSETNADNSAQAAADDKLHRQTPRQQPKNQKPTRKIARQQQRTAKPTLKPAKLMLNPVKQTRRNLRRTHLIIATRRK